MRHLFLGLLLGAPLAGATLSPETVAAFDSYVRRQESASPVGSPSRWPTLNERQFRIAPSAGEPNLDIKDGMIHDWVASSFAPGVTIEKALAVLQDYDRHKLVYAPEVIASRLVSRDGDRFKTYLRLVKKKAITVVLDTEYQVQFYKVSSTRTDIIVRSTSVREVRNAGDKNEEVLPAGEGFGFLWALNSYWKVEARSGGVYIECRAISLTRDVPLGLGFAVKPMVTALPKESLEKTISATIAAAQAR